MTDLVRLYVDGVEHKVPKGANLVDAAKTVGNDVPVFCYHPKLAPVGMCRMCLVDLGQVQVVKETGEWQRDDKGEMVIRWMPKLQTACTTFVVDGMAIRTETPQVLEARDDIIEFLLTSHPLDCPICDKGGECPLQNLTMRHGPGTSRFIFDEKMRLDKHYPLGDLIYLDRERCIQCARCTRFQEELVGDAVLGFHERGRRLQIVTTSTPEFDTYFSGNTTDICPVGALTTADFRFGARPWELTEVPSICPHCPVGCNVSATTRLDRDAGGKTIVKRIMPRQNEDVNEIWICDKGRFGHHHSRAKERITQPMIRQSGKLVPTTWEAAYAAIARVIQNSGNNVGAIAGPMLSNEDLWELRRLVETTGSQQLGVWPYHMTGAEWIAQVGVGTGTNFKDMGKGTTIVVMASDIEEEAPVWYLRIKGAADRGARVVTINPRRTEMDRWARRRIRYNAANPEEAMKALHDLDLSEANNLVIIVGGEGLDRARHGQLMKAAASLLDRRENFGKPNNGLLAVWPGANTQGAFDLGYMSETTEGNLTERPAVLILADADPVGEDALSVNLLKNGFNVVVDMFLTESAKQADVVLPRQSFAERDGTFTNGERRVQRFYPAQDPLTGTLPDWRIFANITRVLGGPKPKLSTAGVMQEIAQKIGRYAGMTYPKLAETKPQFPDVGGTDLYYGGTAYTNTGGAGLQWETSGDMGVDPNINTPNVLPYPPLEDGELLLIPVRELYDRQPEFAASAHLMNTHIDSPYLTLNDIDAATRGVAEGETVVVNYAGQTVEVVARIDSSVAAGTALIGRILSDRPAPAVPVVGTVQKIEVLANA
jgi:NADH-quinone oxidoreductase subunit G